MMRTALASSLLLGLAGCTFSDGTGFATIEAAHLDVAFEPGAARDLGGGAFLTSEGFEVRLQRFDVALGQLTLSELRGAGGSVTAFDPATPPEGYGNCHNGHCHADDGRLVDYADIEAELAGGGATFSAIATGSIGREVSALSAERVPIPSFLPSNELPRTTIERAELDASVVLRGDVRRHAAPSGPVATLSITLPTTRFARGAQLRVGRDGPAHVAIDASFRVDGALLDGVDFDAALDAGQLVVVDSDAPVAIAVLTRLVERALQIRFTAH
ncbi:MAG: hypothetical protein KF718_17870 [Polyangiaceae bacterium]|nr:hypothetical protein [Polyangiaceae bacterium]